MATTRILIVSPEPQAQGRLRESLQSLLERFASLQPEVILPPQLSFQHGEPGTGGVAPRLEPRDAPRDRRVRRSREDAPGQPQPSPPLISVAVTTPGPGQGERRLANFLAELRTLAGGADAVLQTDPPLASALWAGGAPFGVRSEAEALIGKTPPRVGSTKPVHVVIVDQGFDRHQVAGPFGGGWFAPGRSPLPGDGSSPHAAMVARAVRAIAPDAILYDAPMIPTPPPGALATINSVPAFVLDAAAWWTAFGNVVASPWGHGASWVFVNAWQIYDRASELHPLTRYTTDRHHFLNQAVEQAVCKLRVDVVFAAGNCGQFNPDFRCGRNDRGPCRSIWGSNSLDSVLTMGAVRTDRTWLGYSSEGRGQPQLGTDKPDLCAPAEFAADDDAHFVYSGTSAAAGLAGGVVAALRAQTDQTALSPADMIAALRTSALPPEVTDAPYRTGAGVINLARAQDAI